jgi:transcription initiation factor IIE alpha subunit
MAEFTQEELMAKVLEVLATKDKMKDKEIATILDVKKKDVDVAVNALAMEGKVEFLYLGTSYVTLPKA